jgi:hypothetical protein
LQQILERSRELALERLGKKRPKPATISEPSWDELLKEHKAFGESFKNKPAERKLRLV